ncbi:MAG: OsmC family protein [Spirochaetes bacterium]|nr:OsmC family protein [Spirochaetota bacterium]
MSEKTIAEWKGGMEFDVELQGHHFTIDADEKVGGSNKGPRPKSLLLSALAGCTGMDVVYFLRKMRMEWDTFHLEVKGELTGEYPKVFKDIMIRYVFAGDNLDAGKIEKAVKMSQTKYCGVTAMLEKTAKINYEIVLNK